MRAPSSLFVSALRQRVSVFFAAVCLGAGLLISGCGDASTFEPLAPTRFISFGDGLSDLGQTGSKNTVNDGSVNIWVERLAVNYGRTITASVSGGLSFARGGARVNGEGNSIEAQISSFLALPAAVSTFGASDVIVIDAGVDELVALSEANADDAALADAADAAGKAFATQVRRLLAAGANHVVIGNALDLGRTPYATAMNRAAALTTATRKFNDSLKIALADIGEGALLIDNEAYVNLLYNTPTTLGVNGNASSAACTGAVSACTGTNNVVANYAVYLYASDRYLAPTAQRLMGDNAYNKVTARW